jgi:hypothetical protein
MFKTDMVRLASSTYAWLQLKAEICVNGNIIETCITLTLSTGLSVRTC